MQRVLHRVHGRQVYGMTQDSETYLACENCGFPADHPAYSATCSDMEDAAEIERARIVAWLRSDQWEVLLPLLPPDTGPMTAAHETCVNTGRALADAIEQGQHANAK